MFTKNLFLQIAYSLTLTMAYICHASAYVAVHEGELYQHPLFKRQRLQLVERNVSERKLIKKVSFAEVDTESVSQPNLPGPKIKESTHQRMDSVDCVHAIGQIILSGWQVNGSFIDQVADRVDEMDVKYAGTQKYLDAALRKAEIIGQLASNYHKVAGLRLAHKKAQRRTILTGSLYRISQ
jgi:hypothetical protein